jgi:hypothetical protein
MRPWTCPNEALTHPSRGSALVCLVAAPLSQRSRGALRRAGWALQAAPRVASPHASVAPAKLRHVFAKLAVFNLTRFDRVVYLDADTLVLPPGADELFGCRAALCAALRHSERFNSGVMVLTPNAATTANMSRLITVLPSYTGCAPPAEQVASLFLAAGGRQQAFIARDAIRLISSQSLICPASAAQRRPGLLERLFRGPACGAAVRPAARHVSR